MKAILTNLEVPEQFWMKFTRKQLRDLARKHGIMRGQSRRDTAFLLTRGAQYETNEPKTFNISIELHEIE